MDILTGGELDKRKVERKRAQLILRKQKLGQENYRRAIHKIFYNRKLESVGNERQTFFEREDDVLNAVIQIMEDLPNHEYLYSRERLSEALQSLKKYGFKLLAFLGAGCFRLAVLVEKDGKRFVCKIPIEGRGDADNEREVNLFKEAENNGDAGFFAKAESIEKHALGKDEYNIIQQELVKPILNKKIPSEEYERLRLVCKKYFISDFIQVGVSLADGRFKLYDYGKVWT